jgi:hypothetical protein
VGLSTILAAAPAHGTEINLCKTIVLRPISLLYAESEGMPAAEAPPTVKTGRVIRRVTQYVIDRKTGLTGFCAFRDTCYRATATVNGRQVKAQRLLNCTIDFNDPNKDQDEIIYGLIPDPRKNSAHDMRVYRAFEGLLAFGVESEWLATASVDAPRSRCGRIALRALRGDRGVQAALADAMIPHWMKPDQNNYQSCL